MLTEDLVTDLPIATDLAGEVIYRIISAVFILILVRASR